MAYDVFFNCKEVNRYNKRFIILFSYCGNYKSFCSFNYQLFFRKVKTILKLNKSLNIIKLGEFMKIINNL